MIKLALFARLEAKPGKGAAVADLLCSVLNQNVTAWRSSPSAVTIEKQVVRWIADAIDPKNLTITEIGRGPAAPPYTGTATALPVGDTLWLSSFNADRIAYRPLKR